MFRHTSPGQAAAKKGPNKLIAGFAALATTAIIASGGFASATSNHPHASGGGSGYGGINSSIGINLNLNNSNNNVINIIIRIIH